MLVKDHLPQRDFIETHRPEHRKLAATVEHVAKDNESQPDAAENKPQSA